MTHPTDEELDALVALLDCGPGNDRRKAVAALTTLRAQLAEAQHGRNVAEACNRGLVRLNEATQARADRAEAALAAQIEADAGILQAVADNWDCGHNESRYCRCAELAEQWGIAADAIRNQPHSRTALDRMLRAEREKALREAGAAV